MKGIRFLIAPVIFLLFNDPVCAQNDYWQQRADYDIAIDFNHKDHTFRGRQSIDYYNNSPDTLHKLYFHLYYNAFQPNSMMDQWARQIPDPNYGLDYKIKYLTSLETGWIQVSQMLRNGKQMDLIEKGTLLEVRLDEPVLPGDTTRLEMSFAARAPQICRRTGRDNEEGISYTMAQWFPKISVYDRNGWNPTPFIGREFYSNWGDYNVKIRMDSSFILAAGADEIKADTLPGSSKKLWHFISRNVLDFAWTADPDYQHYQVETDDGITLHFYYQEEQNKEGQWIKMAEPLRRIIPYLNKQYGPYPYNSYSIIQGGDGATEYSKSTFITGDRSLGSLVGVSIHEIMHSWFQHMLASQENRYAWMDEGFSSFATTEIKQYMRKEGIFFGEPLDDPFEQQYKNYLLLARSGLEEPMNTPANFFRTNTAYNLASYDKGELFLLQLRYILGGEVFEQGLRNYIAKWRFKHPTPDDFIRVMEKTSGIELDWFQYFWTQTTHTIDYAVRLDSLKDGQSLLSIERLGVIPMPVDIRIDYRDGSQVQFLIPLDLMQSHKPLTPESNQVVLQEWPWTHRIYQVQLNNKLSEILSVQLDPSREMADINRENNRYPRD
jgi:hypothetical protein